MAGAGDAAGLPSVEITASSLASLVIRVTALEAMELPIEDRLSKVRCLLSSLQPKEDEDDDWDWDDDEEW